MIFSTWHCRLVLIDVDIYLINKGYNVMTLYYY